MMLSRCYSLCCLTSEGTVFDRSRRERSSLVENVFRDNRHFLKIVKTQESVRRCCRCCQGRKQSSLKYIEWLIHLTHEERRREVQLFPMRNTKHCLLRLFSFFR